MDADEFFEEVSRTLGIKLLPKDFEYRSVDEALPPPSGPTVATIGPWRQTVTITHLPSGKSKSYAAGHGSSFPVEFIADWQAGEFA